MGELAADGRGAVDKVVKGFKCEPIAKSKFTSAPGTKQSACGAERRTLSA
jgi:hypothetical protein